MAKRLDILEAGTTFGRLTIINYNGYHDKHHFYLCVCDCGNQKEMKLANLIIGDTKSCGCFHRESAREKKLIHLEGQRFGKLMVMNCIKEHSGKNAKWLCRCDCGNEAIVESGSLRSGHTKSCGCLKGSKPGHGSLPYGQAAFNAVNCFYRNSATKRNICFDLTKDEFMQITQQNCHYCGVHPENVYTLPTGQYIYNGIDRKNNNVGYTIENCVPCCEICNKAKRHMGYDDFLKWINRLTIHQTERTVN